MSCEQTRLYLHPYLDDELGVADAVRFQEHLETCAECRLARGQALALRSALRGSNLRYDASAALATRVQGAVLRTAAPARRLNSYVWMGLAAAIIVTVGLVAILMNRTGGREELLARAVVESHIRSLQANHLVDVESSDRHTVKPWFQGKLDYAPTVPDLAAQGWPLEGGRLDYLDGRAVAALVYERRKHRVNVFVWPAGGRADEAVRQEALQGYNVVHWTHGGMTYWVASDVNGAELAELAGLLRGQ